MPKLDTHRHFSYELLTAFLGDLLAVPQVNMTDISTAFEEGQALVSDLIAVCRKEKNHVRDRRHKEIGRAHV